MKLPSVTVITPSNRPENLPSLINMFNKQDYENKSLCIVSDGTEAKWSSVGNIVQFTMMNSTIGAKRNAAVWGSTGEIIVHFDDDDWYAHDYISRSVEHLINSKADVTGLDKLYFYRPHSDLWLYTYLGKQRYVVESGMCYWRKTWDRTKFANTSVAEGIQFLAMAGDVIPHDYTEGMLAILHRKNTASHNELHKVNMKKLHPSYAVAILGEDYNLYG